MADDIDIEEHDVLESLRRRQGPDVVVKSEPLEIEYEESNYEEPANYEYQWEWDKDQAPEIKIEPHTEDEFRFGKIILGSKPADPETPDKAGSSRDEPANYNYNMSLVVDDWGPMLERSDCYCKTCQILFATVNALDAHKMIVHSFLVATEKQPSPDRNKAIKSTAKPSNHDDRQTCKICKFSFKGTNTQARCNLLRHYRQVHQVDTNNLDINSDFKSWRICNHCNLYFPDDTSLVKHLYELLPINNKTPTKDDKKAVGQSAVKAKPVNIDSNKVTPNKEVKSTNVKVNTSNDKEKNPLPNRIILGSKPAAVKTETIDNDEPIKWKCEVCGILYGRKYYVKHMNKFHPGYLAKKAGIQTDKKQPDKIVLNNTRIRYKCDVCSEILTSYYGVRTHRLKHPEAKGKKLFTKLVKLNKISKVKVKPSLMKKELGKAYAPKVIVKKEPVEESKSLLVSKSTLFKCSRCSVHFLTCTGACQHSMVCETSSNIRDWACPKCQRVFKSSEKSSHEYQHKMMNANKFKVYIVYLEMIVRVLCECPMCFICFEEDKFWRHVGDGCNDAASYYCSECKLPIDIHSKANHDSKHKQGDFTKDDFIKIDYHGSKNDLAPKKIQTELIGELTSPVKNVNEIGEPRKALKRKLEISEVPEKKKKSKISEDLLLYYCQFCKSYLGAKNTFHSSGSCKDQKLGLRVLCKICGIYFKTKYYATHMSFHEKYPGLTLSDYTIVRMNDERKMKPLPEFLPCKHCHVNFLTKANRVRHKCGHMPSSSCQVCQKKIHKDVFKLHMQIHNYVIPSQIKTIHDIAPSSLSRKNTKSPMTQNLTRKETKSHMTTLPDLLMKYQSLTALWNILYLCSTCDTFTDSYDKVIDHCQNHLTNMENYGVVIKKCQICDMKFDSECYKRHLELHAGSKVINEKTFQILTYDYQNLFSELWFDFIDLSEDQKSQIVRRSIYGATRCVKMRLIQQGPPEYTLYKCSKCLNCVAADTIVYHVKLAQCIKANKLACSICEMTFSIRAQLNEHEQIHKMTGLGLESFRIVSFNDPSDAESNKKIMSYDTENHGSRSKISFVDDEVLTKTPKLGQSNKTFVLYKCAECERCVLHIRNFARHACHNEGNKKCEMCGLIFHTVGFHNHLRLHEKYSFTSENVITKTLNKQGKVINIKKLEKSVGENRPTLKENAEKSKLYKCYCGLHYTSLKTIEKHYKMKNCSTVIREKCSQCNLVFDPIEVVNHLCKHHAQNHVKAFNIVTPNKKTLYKCSLCHVLFYSKAAALPHKAKCSGKVCGKKCEKCGLAFDATSLPTHMIDHERNNKLKPDCYMIVKIPDEKITEIRKVISPNILHKCKFCDIHFVRRSSARNHMLNRCCATTLTETCRICKLRFPVKSMPIHLSYQHSKMKGKAFNVRELALKVNLKAPGGNGSDPETVKSKVVQQEPKEVPKLPKAEPVDVTVYRCVKCMLHFTDESSLVNHQEDRCSKELTEECEDCSAKFASKSIREHKKQHGPGITLTLNIIEDVQLPPIREDVNKEIVKISTSNTTDLERYDNKVYKCTGCNLHYNCYTTLVRHAKYERCKPNTIHLKCEECNIDFTKHSLCRHKQIHDRYNFKKDDFVILTWSMLEMSKVESNQGDVTINQENEDDTEVLESSFESEPVEKLENKIKEQKIEATNKQFLFKCADCNVYYSAQKTVHKHVANHTPLDPKDYIECKLCGFQFTVMGLPPHIKKHHQKPFNLEEVLVEEYQPNDITTHEKYYASEKDQSRLVSTSDDVNNVSNLIEDNDCEVSSCVEIGERVGSSDNLEQLNKGGTGDKDMAENVDSSDSNDQVVNTGEIDNKMSSSVEIATKVESTDNKDQILKVNSDVTDDVIPSGEEIVKNVISSDNDDQQGNDEKLTTCLEISKSAESSNAKEQQVNTDVDGDKMTPVEISKIDSSNVTDDKMKVNDEINNDVKDSECNTNKELKTQ